MPPPPPPPGFTIDGPPQSGLGRPVIRKGLPPTQPRKQIVGGSIVDLDTGTATPVAGLPPAAASTRQPQAIAGREGWFMDSDGNAFQPKGLPPKANLTPDKLNAVRADAANKINTIRRVRAAISSKWFPNVTGAGWGDVLKRFPGTSARGIDAMLGTLKSGGALAEVLKMSQETGKNPFTPMSNSDVELIAKNIGNLDQGQSMDDLFKQLDLYEGAYGRGYMGAGGDPKKLLDRNRDDGPFPRQRNAKPKAKPGVIDFNDLP